MLLPTYSQYKCIELIKNNFDENLTKYSATKKKT